MTKLLTKFKTVWIILLAVIMMCSVAIGLTAALNKGTVASADTAATSTWKFHDNKESVHDGVVSHSGAAIFANSTNILEAPDRTISFQMYTRLGVIVPDGLESEFLIFT